MKIVITYASAGAGHCSAAWAIYEYIKDNHSEIEIEIVDILRYCPPLLSLLYSKGYRFFVTHLEFAWALLYNLTKRTYILEIFNRLCQFKCHRFKQYIIQQNPSVILATHFFPAAVCDYLKIKHAISSRLITVITDFGVHPLWLTKQGEYIVGTTYTRSCLLAHGTPPEKIKVFGIPVNSRFLQLREAGKGKERKLSALVITGSFGFSIIEKIVRLLHRKIKLFVVCGNNRKLYQRLKKKRYFHVLVFQFTGDIANLMAESDIIITKPGGLTISEALIMELPMIFIDGIYGQEIENAKIIEGYGCAVRARSLLHLDDLIRGFKDNPQNLDFMRANIRKVRKANTAEDIYKEICCQCMPR